MGISLGLGNVGRCYSLEPRGKKTRIKKSEALGNLVCDEGKMNSRLLQNSRLPEDRTLVYEKLSF